MIIFPNTIKCLFYLLRPLYMIQHQIERECQMIYNDKADSYPQHVGKFFNFRIFIEFFNHEVKKILKFLVSGPYFYNKYQ